MSFVYLGGDDSNKPTYFEVIAADKLAPSLKAAIVYTLSVLSQRHSWLHQLLDFEDEVFAVTLLLLDWHSLATADATFAEALYGLKRRSLRKDAQGHDWLSQRQRRLGLLLEVLLPYLKAKSDRWYKLQTNQGVLGLALRRQQQQPSNQDTRGMPVHARVQRWLLQAAVAAYPWLHAGVEAATFGYHLLYLLGSAEMHRPVLHAHGIQMARVSGQDLMRLEKEKQARRKARLDRTARHLAPVAFVQRLLLQGLHLVSDNMRYALIFAVFGFKTLEWWYSSAEERLAVSKALPPPPPPPAPQPAPDGVGLPQDPSHCPVCRKPCVNPAQVATSGYVFCYQCAFNYVMQHSCCPVTQLPASLDHIRRLYEAA